MRVIREKWFWVSLALVCTTGCGTPRVSNDGEFSTGDGDDGSGAGLPAADPGKITFARDLTERIYGVRVVKTTREEESMTSLEPQ